MYTDGLSEARDVTGDFLPVSSLATQGRTGPVSHAVDEIVAAVAAYVPRGRLDDDLAVVLIEHRGVGSPQERSANAGCRQPAFGERHLAGDST